MNPIEKYGWVYRLNKVKGKIEVIPSEKDKRELPKTLHKYYALNDNLVKSLKGEYLYAPHPEQLNDPFDCSYQLIDLQNAEKIHEITQGYYTIEEIHNKINDKNFMANITYNYRLQNFQKYGLISLAEDSESIPMWAYYGNNRGICIEYDYNKFEFDYLGPFQVNYQEDISPISYLDADDLALIYQANIKTLVWKHELEWRILPYKLLEKGKPDIMAMPEIDRISQLQNEKKINPKDRHFECPPSCVKSIILGPYFFHPNNEYEVKSQSQRLVTLKTDNKSEDIRRYVIDYINTNRIPLKIMGRDESKFRLIPVSIKITQTDNDHYLMETI